MSLNVIFTDDFNDDDYTDKWTLTGDAAAFVEEDGVLKATPVPSVEDSLVIQDVTVVAGKVYRVDFIISYKDGNAAGVNIRIGNISGISGKISMASYGIGKHSVNVTAPESTTCGIYVSGTGGGAWFDSLIISEEKFIAMST